MSGRFAPRLLAAASLVALLAAGCAVGPDFRPPAPPATPAFTRPGDAAAAAVRTEPVEPRVEWWRTLRSPIVDAAISRALAHSPTIAAAEASLRQANELAVAQSRALWPSVTAGMTPTRQRTSKALSPALASNALLYSLHTSQVTVSYVPDVFGGGRRGAESQAAQAEMAAHQRDAARQMLAANLASALVQLAALNDQVDSAGEIVSATGEALRLTRRQEALGAMGKLDVSTQDTALRQAEQALATLRKQKETTRDAVAVLMGEAPADLQLATLHLSDLELPEAIAVSVPAELVRRRPDIRAAEAQVHAATAQVGVAVANRFPQFSINAALGGASPRFGAMFSSANMFWSLLGGVTQPIFDFGMLKHRRRAAEAGMEVAMAQYRGTVLVALQNVADALYALHHDGEALQAADHNETATRQTLTFAERGRALGASSALNVLSARQAWQQARLGVIQARAQRLQDAIALMAAVAGPANGADPVQKR